MTTDMLISLAAVMAIGLSIADLVLVVHASRRRREARERLRRGVEGIDSPLGRSGSGLDGRAVRRGSYSTGTSKPESTVNVDIQCIRLGKTVRNESGSSWNIGPRDREKTKSFNREAV